MIKKGEDAKSLPKYANNDPVIDVDGVLTFVLGSQIKSDDGTRTFSARVGIGLGPGTWKEKKWVRITYKQAAKMLAFIKKNAEVFNGNLDKEIEEEAELQRAG